MEKPEFTLEAESFRQKSDLPMNADGTQLAVGSSVSPFGEYSKQPTDMANA